MVRINFLLSLSLCDRYRYSDHVADVHTPRQRSFNMSRIAGRNTRPEMRVRAMLHALGFRYRLHPSRLPGKPDLVFPAAKVILFVHGCFWHMHRCKYGKPVPATNVSFWAEKRRGNVERDKRNRKALRGEGWKVFEVWECHTRDLERLRQKLGPLIQYLQASR
jgi:DNA mismatch endonuclease (patch repair protein)